MAAIRVSNKQIVCISKENILVLNLGSRERNVYQSIRPKLPEADERKQLVGNEEGTQVVLACAFSPSGEFFVSCDDYKQVTTWRVTDDGSWQSLSTRFLQRRVTRLIFTTDGSAVLIGDKSGDVYNFSISNPEEDGELLMGHVSMLLDMVLCNEDKLLITSDRDEKIRVSHFPNAYSIHSYCLGHSDFVSCLGYFPADDILVSGSGDGTLRLWNYKLGEELAQIQCRPQIDQELSDVKPKSDPGAEDLAAGAAACDGDPSEAKMDLRQARLKAKEQQGLDLKCLSCCQRLKRLAVGFDRLPVVLLYEFQSDSTIAFTFDSKISLAGPLWDLSFDPDGHLYVLHANERTSLLVYKLCQQSHQMIPLSEIAVNDPILTSVSTVNSEWDILKGSLEQDSIFSVLHKVRVDNAKLYLEQKERKLDEQKQRYKSKQERRKRGKDVLPPSECPQRLSDDMPPTVAPSSECDEKSSNGLNPSTKKVKHVS